VVAFIVYRRKDAFYARARAVGYRSRAAFKLLELAQRTRLFRRGDRVLDIGAWPGGWLQVAAELVGPTGKVIGIDLHPIEPLPGRHVTTQVGDIGDEMARQRIVDACQGQVDVVLSDVAPKLSGVRVRDEARSEALAACALALCEKVLRPGGTFVMKLFTGEAATRLVRELRVRFDDVRTSRPEATRRGSSEIYAIAVGFRSRRGPPTQ
jgi:23S rRNA (uridine2552-2'-O)-methyltransferase